MFWIVGKAKTSDSLSQIYSSLWKPWSYLTGSSEAKPAGTDDPDLTAQTTSIKGFYFNLQLSDLWKHKLAGFYHKYYFHLSFFLQIHPPQAPQRAVVMFCLPTGRDWWTWRRRPLPALMLVSVISSILKHWRDLRIKDLPVTPASDPWSSESSGSFVTLQLIPGQSWFDWGESLDPGLGSEEFLRPLVNPTPAEKKVLLQSSSSF